MENEFPGTWEYLNDYYERLIPKHLSPTKKGRDMSHGTLETWYHYGRIQHLASYNNTDKLIVKVMKNNVPLIRMDKNDMLIASGGTAGYVGIIKKEDSPYALEYIQAVLSHPSYQILSSIIGSDFEGGYNATGTAVLYDMPIRKIDFNNQEQVSLYNTIVEISKEIYKINEKLSIKLSNRESTALIRERDRLIRIIQKSVTRLYGIEELMQVLENR